MEGYVLVILFVLGTPLIWAIWLSARAVSARQRIEELTARLARLESEVRKERKAQQTKPAEADETYAARYQPKPTYQPQPAPEPPVFEPPPLTQPEPVFRRSSSPPPPIAPTVEPPVPGPIAQPQPQASAPLPPKAAPAWKPAFDWEQFMGVRLFAWAGGLALFLGIAFFIKYSFEKNWFPPELRVALGFAAGLAALIVGVVMSRKGYLALAHSLCGAGVVILYAATFACRGIYHFEFFGVVPTFLLMVLITTTAFLLAVRLEALAVAILGMLGGFLTPVLLATGQDSPFGLFSYIALLDAGLLLVALHRRWFFLAALAAAGTILTQIGWANEFFSANKYFVGNNILIPLGVLAGFNALYLAGAFWAKRRNQLNWWLGGSLLGLAGTALIFTAWFFTFPTLAQRPWLMFSFVFLIDLAVSALGIIEEDASVAQPIAGIAVFALLTAWTQESLSENLLNAALTFYLGFALLHTLFPIFLHRRLVAADVRKPETGRAASASQAVIQIFPPIALLLVLIPIFRLSVVSFMVWPFVLFIDLLAIFLAVLAGSLLPVLAVLVLTLTATGALLFKIPETLTGLPTFMWLLAAFTVFFVLASVWLSRKIKSAAGNWPLNLGGLPTQNLEAQLPALSAILPFLLLIMATLRLPLTSPTPVFGLGLLLVVLLFGIARLFSFDLMAAIALGCIAALEAAWHFNRFNPASPHEPLAWYLIFLGAFSVFPFVFWNYFRERLLPWATAALAGVPQFFLIHRLVSASYPNEVMGFLPAAFAIPPLASLVIILKKVPPTNPARLSQLAWFGGVALFFITLIFPIQFERQWLTIGWALEGVALLWLFHRVPHWGLRVVGTGLLIAAFVRLALNPAVFEYHIRSSTPILNWYLYAYGVVTLCLFAGARLLLAPRNRILDLNIPPLLSGLGIVLAFWLLNIEIADYFSPPGATFSFEFTGNLKRDMAYSIAWALFALVLLVIGITSKNRGLRYAGVGLLSVTIIKLFLHDLAHLNQLYRIGAFIGVAVIAMLASFAYHRFFAAGLKAQQSTNEPAVP